MTYFTQLVFVKKGKEEIFHEFEDFVLPLLARYAGRLLYRVRPAAESVLHSEVGTPYEIHLVAFPSEADFQAYAADEERQRYLGLKNESVQEVLLIRGSVA